MTTFDQFDSPFARVSIADIFTRPAPPREFVVGALLPTKEVTLLPADGGVGKSMLALIQAVCVAMNLPFMGVRGLPNGAHTLEYRVVSRCKPVTADEMVAAYTLEMDVELAGSSGHRTITIDAVRARDGWHAGDVDGTVLDSPIGHPLTITGHEPDGSTVVWDAGISQGWLLEQGKQWLPDVPALDLQRDLVLETTLVNGEENGAGNCAAIHLLGLRD